MLSSFAEDVGNYADAGCTALEVWLPKLEKHLEHHSIAETSELLETRGVTLVAAAYQGGLLLSEGDARQAHYEHFRRRLDLCQRLKIPTLIVAADVAQRIDQAAFEQAVRSLREAAQWAAGFDVMLAFEFGGRGTFCTSLDTAVALIHECGEPNVGVNLDVFYYYSGPSKHEDLSLLTAERIAHVQIADLAGVPRELATDADRVLPGDGDFQLQPILDALRGIGYQRYVSLELMNPTLWRADPRQVAEIAFTSLRNTLGLGQPAVSRTSRTSRMSGKP